MLIAQIDIVSSNRIDIVSIILCTISLISLLFVVYEQHKA
jgi:hypothetical protein